MKAASARPAPWLALALVVLALAAWWPVGGHGFVEFDDPAYVTANRHVTAGLTAEGFRWAFTSVGYASNWHPLTWLSHMADVSLFGLDPGAHHLVNLLWHLLSSALLFFLLKGMTGALWGSFLAAALFALHPLHVESVAWVSERKDVLSSFLGLAAAAAWLRYARRPSPGRYLGVFLLLALGLMAKPMLVTMPLLLVLLDWWPLGRMRGPRGASPLRLALEKLPLAALAAASSALTLAAQSRGGAMSEMDARHFSTLLSNVPVSYVRYLWRTVWPVRLSVFYPLEEWPLWQTAGAVALLASAGLAAGALRRRRPWLLLGLSWFAAGLLPVIGLVQVGSQGMADRYMYLPLAGPLVAASWELRRLSRLGPAAAGAAALVAASALAALFPLTRFQLGHWRDSESLFARTMELDPANWLAANNMGLILCRRGSYGEAEPYFRLAAAGRRSARHLTNLATTLARLGRPGEAVALYAEALRIDPRYADAHYNLGLYLARSGRHDEAVAEFRRALQIESSSETHNNLGASLWALGRVDEAIGEYRRSLESEPLNFNALNNLGVALRQKGLAGEAEESFREALGIKADFPEAMVNLGDTLAGRGRGEEAAAWYRRALELRPNDPVVRSRVVGFGK